MPYPFSNESGEEADNVEVALMCRKDAEWIDISQNSKLLVEKESNTVKFELEHFCK